MTTKDMLQALINGQSALKEELLKEITKVRIDLESFRRETKGNFKKINDRLDKQGKQLAYLEDDAPTREEFDTLTKQVDKLKHN